MAGEAAANSEPDVPITPSRPSIQDISALTSTRFRCRQVRAQEVLQRNPTRACMRGTNGIYVAATHGRGGSLQTRLREKEIVMEALAEEVVTLTTELEEVNSQVSDRR